jgi:hypothetical protein
MKLTKLRCFEGLAGYPAIFSILYPAGYPASQIRYPAGYPASQIRYPAGNWLSKKA